MKRFGLAPSDVVGWLVAAVIVVVLVIVLLKLVDKL